MIKPKDGKCTYPGCNEKYKCKGFCHYHYKRYRKGADMDAPKRITIKGPKDGKCIVSKCNRKHRSKGYCKLHYSRIRFGVPLDHPYRKRYKGLVPIGSVRTTSKGYSYIKISNDLRKGNWVKEHKYVMEKHIGRELFSHESIHHKNGIKNDNRIENLELWSKSQPYGQKVSDKVKWAIEILEEYAPSKLNK